MAEFRYFMLHKPYGCVTARRDDRYSTVMDLFSELDCPDLSPVGRLDRQTEGLLFVTNDGMWNRAMTRPEFAREKVYTFTVLGDLTAEKAARLEQGVLLQGDDRPTQPAGVQITGRTVLSEYLDRLHPEVRAATCHNRADHPITFGQITISEGRNRQIRRMMKVVGCVVLELKRISIDGMVLDPDLWPGQWKEFDPKKEAF